MSANDEVDGDRPVVTVTVFGTVSVTVDRSVVPLAPSEQQIVAVLAAAGVNGLTQDQLADELWGDRLPRTWASALRNRVAHINRACGTILIPRGQRRLDLPESQVDAWRLLVDDVRRPDRDLLLGVPFAGVEISDRIRQVTDQILARRRDLIQRWEGDDLTSEELSVVRSVIDEDPFDLRTLGHALRAHARAGDRRGADQLLAVARNVVEILGPGARADLAELEAIHEGIAVAAERSAPPTPTETHTVAAAVRRLAGSRLIGRSQLVGDLLEALGSDSCPGVVLEGVQGVGKTRLAAELGMRLFDAGRTVAYLSGSPFAAATALQPFVEQLPGLGARIGPMLSGRLDDPTDRAACWVAVQRYLDERASRRPLVLIVDDAHWLDRLSVFLLGFLARCDLAPRVQLVVVGRTDPGGALWPSLRDELSRASVPHFQIEPMDEGQLRDLVVQITGLRQPLLVAAVASAVAQRCNGIVSVARSLIEGIDPARPLDTLPVVMQPGYAALVAGLDGASRSIGAAAAVLGERFALDELLFLTGQTTEALLAAVECLLGAGLVEETSRPDEWRFVHLLAAEALRTSLVSARRIRLHERALGLGLDVHRRAWHSAEAADLVGRPAAAAAACQSARMHHATGNYPEVIRMLAAAQRFDPSSLRLTDRILLTESLDRTGQPAGDLRRAVVAEALAAGDPALAVEAATAGLPETEQLDGDRQRVDLIASIEPALLSARDRGRRAVHLSRQLLLCGELSRARAVAMDAFDQAASPNDRAEAWVAVRHAEGWSPLTEGRLGTAWLAGVSSRRLAARVAEARMVADLARGLSRAGLDTLERLLATARADGDALGQWYTLLMHATAMIDLGRIDEARVASEAAEQIGYRYGLASAEGAAGGQRFFWLLLGGTSGDALEAPLNVSGLTGNVLVDAGWALALAAAGQHGEARAKAEATAARAAQSRFELAVLGLLCPVLAVCDRGLVDHARTLLAERSATNLIVGVGLADLGPCSRLLAQLSRDDREATDLLRQAVARSDTALVPLWQVRCRLDLARRVRAREASELLDQARQRATTPWLGSMVDAAGQ